MTAHGAAECHAKAVDIRVTTEGSQAASDDLGLVSDGTGADLVVYTVIDGGGGWPYALYDHDQAKTRGRDIGGVVLADGHVIWDFRPVKGGSDE